MRQTIIPLVLALVLPLTACEDKTKSEDSSNKEKPKYHTEALNMVATIARNARGTFEREVDPSVFKEGEEKVEHLLCKSAQQVPVKVPTGSKGYQPNQAADADFNQGDRMTGWPCLMVAITQPIHCQYSYIVGKGFKSTKRGNTAIDESKAMKGSRAMAFEAAAECDFDGDGVTSLYASTGTIDPKSNQLKLSKKVFIDKDGE